MATSEHRVAVILPPDEKRLAEAIAAKLKSTMGAGGGVSGAIRAAIRAYARELGVEAEAPSKKKRTKTA